MHFVDKIRLRFEINILHTIFRQTMSFKSPSIKILQLYGLFM